MRKALCLLLVGTALTATVHTGWLQGTTPNTLTLPEGVPRPPARVTDFGWLTGRWTGEGLGGRIEEVWSPPDGGAMVGYFRLVKDDKPVFYEILTLIEIEGSVEMRLKHVNPDMTGWEDKDASSRSAS
jgi:hypothetical protein